MYSLNEQTQSAMSHAAGASLNIKGGEDEKNILLET
jgi:hypothetical protein